MFTFIRENIGSLLVLFIILAIVTLVCIFRFRKRRRGEGGCGSGCKTCPMATKCHREEERK